MSFKQHILWGNKTVISHDDLFQKRGIICPQQYSVLGYNNHHKQICKQFILDPLILDGEQTMYEWSNGSLY